MKWEICIKCFCCKPRTQRKALKRLFWVANSTSCFLFFMEHHSDLKKWADAQIWLSRPGYLANFFPKMNTVSPGQCDSAGALSCKPQDRPQVRSSVRAQAEAAGSVPSQGVNERRLTNQCFPPSFLLSLKSVSLSSVEDNKKMDKVRISLQGKQLTVLVANYKIWAF